MSKKDLIDAVAKDTDLTKEKAGQVVEAMITHIQDTLKAGGEVRLPGFGSFKVTLRPARKARNPQTGKEMDLPETNVAKFQVSKNLKEYIN